MGNANDSKMRHESVQHRLRPSVTRTCYACKAERKLGHYEWHRRCMPMDFEENEEDRQRARGGIYYCQSNAWWCRTCKVYRQLILTMEELAAQEDDGHDHRLESDSDSDEDGDSKTHRD